MTSFPCLIKTILPVFVWCALEHEHTGRQLRVASPLQAVKADEAHGQATGSPPRFGGATHGLPFVRNTHKSDVKRFGIETLKQLLPSMGHAGFDGDTMAMVAQKSASMLHEDAVHKYGRTGGNWHPASLERLLIVPDHKLMFCFVDRSPLNSLINDLNGFPKMSRQHDRDYASSAMGSHFHWDSERTLTTLKSKDWYKVVFFQDPMERLLANYLKECVTAAADAGGQGSMFTSEQVAAARIGDKHGNGTACLFFEEEVMRGDAPYFPEFVEFLQRGLDRENDGQDPVYNPHFTRQSDFCGGIDTADYDFIGGLEGDMNQMLTAIFSQLKADVGGIVNEHFPKGGPPAAQIPSNDVFKMHFHDVDTVLAARQLYNADYETLEKVTGKPPPANICINAMFALNFEKRRILDWVAYHSLLGVDCFILFHDNERSDVSDPEVREVYDKLSASSAVTLFQAKSRRDRSRIANDEEWLKYFGTKYLLIIDIDEFVVIDGDGDGNSTAPKPPNLSEFLEAKDVSRDGAIGMYLNRWDYGTGGHLTPPSLAAFPEFALFTERWGMSDRAMPEKNLGKMILNMQTGISEKYLSVHRWNPKGGGTMLFPNGTEMCLEACGHNGKNPQKPTTKQPISLNHYATGSLSECEDKAKFSRFFRKDRSAECQKLHPKSESYISLSSTTGIVEDNVLVKYAAATRQRGKELFG